MIPKENAGQKMTKELEPGRNIVDQEPFLSLRQQLPEDFFVGDKENQLRGLGTFVRALAMEPNKWVNQMSENPIHRCKKYIAPKYWTTNIDSFREKSLAYLSQPQLTYWNNYLHEFWITQTDTFTNDGFPWQNPKTSRKQPLIIPFFAAYQARKLGDPSLGLQSILPTLQTAESLRDERRYPKR